MADAAAETIAPPEAAPEVEAPATEPAPAPFVDPVEEAFGRFKADSEGEETAEPAAEPEPGEPKPEGEPKTAAAPLADADEALFSDKALTTPKGIQAAAERLRQLRAESTASLQKYEQRQRKLDKFELGLKSREKKFDRTKTDHLAWHAEQREMARVNGAHLGVLATTTNPKQFLESLGFLSHRDARAAYEMIVAGGAGLRKEPSPEFAELQRQHQELRAELQRERAESKAAAERQHKMEVVERREAEIIGLATNEAAYPHLAGFAAERPQEVLDYIVALKDEHRRTYDSPLSDADAILQIEQSLARRIAARGGTGNPRPPGNGSSTNPGGQSGQSSPAKQPSLVAGIPPSASTRVPVQREPTEEERRQELTPEFFQSIGLY